MTVATWRKRLDAIEARMAKLTAAIQKIDAAMEDGSAFRENAAKAGEIATMRSDAAEEKWLTVSTGIEAA